MNRFQTNTSDYSESVQRLQRKKVSELVLSGSDLHDLICDVLSKEMPFRFKARGSSMSPFIKDGDVLTICPKRRKFFIKGTVVAYNHRKQNKIVIHRIIGKINDTTELKGDNTVGDADVVNENDILGYVSKVERSGRKTHIGLGPGRILISFLSRRDLLIPVMLPFRKIFYPIVKRVLS